MAPQANRRNVGICKLTYKETLFLAMLAFALCGVLAVHVLHNKGGALQAVNNLLSLERQAFVSFSSLHAREVLWIAMQFMLGWAKKQPPPPILYLWPNHGCAILLQRQQGKRDNRAVAAGAGAQTQGVLAMVDDSHVLRWTDQPADDAEDSEHRYATCTFPQVLLEGPVPTSSTDTNATASDWKTQACEYQPTPGGARKPFSCLYLMEGGGSDAGVPNFYKGEASLQCDSQGGISAVCKMVPDTDWQADARDAWDRFPGGVPDAKVLHARGISLVTLP